MTNDQLEPTRFDCGVFSGKKGDIAEAYSADVFPKIRTPFTHDGILFTAGNYCNRKAGGYYADCYAMNEVEKGTESGPKVQYSCENNIVHWKGKQFKLGPKTVLRSRPLAMPELQLVCRTQYAHGGYFAARFGSYSAMALDLSRDGTPLEKLVYLTEAADPSLPQTQTAMLEFLKEAI